MSMHTIYAVIGPTAHGKTDVQLWGIATSTQADKALEELRLFFTPPGEIFACRISEDAAREVKDALNQPGTVSRGKPATSALALLKRYSHSLQKVADLT